MSSNENAHAHHVTPLWIYIGVWVSLMILTAVTVWVAQFDFGAMNGVVAMTVATIKASLVALFFMHLYWDEKMNLLAFVASLLFVGLFFVFTFADEMTRGKVDPLEANFAEMRKEDQLLGKPDTAYNKGKRPDHAAHGGAPAGHGGEGHGGEAAPAGH